MVQPQINPGCQQDTCPDRQWICFSYIFVILQKNPARFFGESREFISFLQEFNAPCTVYSAVLNDMFRSAMLVKLGLFPCSLYASTCQGSSFLSLLLPAPSLCIVAICSNVLHAWNIVWIHYLFMLVWVDMPFNLCHQCLDWYMFSYWNTGFQYFLLPYVCLPHHIPL